MELFYGSNASFPNIHHHLHKSHASFGTFIRPRICLRLMNAKKREVKHRARLGLVLGPGDADGSLQGVSVIETYPDSGAAPFTEAVADAALREDFFAALPALLTCLTRREREVFEHLRRDATSRAIAEALKVSQGRVSQLRK